MMKNSAKENPCILFPFVLTRKQIKYCSGIQTELQKKSGNYFMIENKVPPHIILGKTLDNIAVKDNQSSRGSGIIPGPLEY